MKEYKKRIADLILTDKLEWSEKRRQVHSSELMTIFAIDYTNAMMKRILIPIVALICLFCLSNCEKEGPVEPSIKMLYGDYTLSDIHWPGLAVDLNDDGAGYWELLYEFQNKLGYYEPDYTAVVNDGITYSYTESWAEDVTAFHISIPYPYLVEKEGEWKCTGIQTLKYTIRATKKSFHLIANCCHTYPGFNDPTNIFLSNIQDISLVVNSYDSDTFKVGLHCKLPCVSGDSKTLNENYLYYEFKKR